MALFSNNLFCMFSRKNLNGICKYILEIQIYEQVEIQVQLEIEIEKEIH